MNRFRSPLLVIAVFLCCGCDRGESNVIAPQDYQLSDQEQSNRQRAEKALAEHRQ